jgi:hypothetical protein
MSSFSGWQYSSFGSELLSYDTVNIFRSSRGKVLRKLINDLHSHLGRDIRILDVGGRPDYWLNVGFDNVSKIEVINLEPSEIDRQLPPGSPEDIFSPKIGDARKLTDYADNSVDLVHSNSVIEHVGSWKDMEKMACELMRVGRAGWIQTPAWAFPLEPHFRVPFAHWFGRPLQAKMLSLSFVERYRKMGLVDRRRHVERINLLSRREVQALFPGHPIYVEWFIFPKSYSVHWRPNGV